MRQLKYFEAIREATEQCMANDSRVYVIGLGATDPKGIFGTTLGLEQQFGSDRCMDMPTAENGMTGIILGSAMMGMRPILTHQRVDFTLYSFDQIINNAAKWYFMYGGKSKMPVVIRMIIGRGWGQGPQHSQSLHSIFGHIPGLKVVMPATPYDVKGMLIEAVEDDSPVIFLEHRWLYNTFGEVPEEMYRVPFGKVRIMREGSDVTIVSASYMAIESLKAAEILREKGVSAEVVDVRSIKPLDSEGILSSVAKTGHLVVVDGAWSEYGFASEVMAVVTESLFSSLKSAPVRICCPNVPTSSTAALANLFYPRAIDIANKILHRLEMPLHIEEASASRWDVPDQSFTGPF